MTGDFFVDREFFKMLNKRKFSFLSNVLNKMIYLYIIFLFGWVEVLGEVLRSKL